MTKEIFRIGQGYDIHPLVTGRKLILGGVEIPHSHGLAGHSDADVLCHSIIDAILGAAGLGDIGSHFPDNDPQYKNISSCKLLQQVTLKIETLGWKINNLDCIVIIEKPKISSFNNVIKQSIANSLTISSELVNIKAKTNEQLDAVGKEQAISSLAVVLLSKMSSSI